MTWERYTSQVTGWEGDVWSGRTFTPRFHCHDDVGSEVELYDEKPPVCNLSLVPRVQYIGEAIAWNIGDSFSATDTVDLFSIEWGGATDIGDLSDEDFNVDPTSGDVVYDELGTYTVEAWVVDVLTTESQHVFITVEIVEPVERLYIGTTDAGVFISDDGAEPVASNTGLSGDQLLVRSLHVHPAYADLPADQQHIWIATADGVSYSTDGGANWTNIDKDDLGEPENAAEDDPAPTTGDLDQIDISFDPQDPRRVYLRRTIRLG
jgi:hypothetical protein